MFEKRKRHRLLNAVLDLKDEGIIDLDEYTRFQNKIFEKYPIEQ